ncbi:hypothetical protein MalM25_37810 [Planctomycetes bacterium MalM25]|nr:hypothetical protein MalM25_37810 [Planctomycetes bacterium MalM25]
MGVPEAEFSKRVDLTKDQCVIDEEYFFVRGHIEIPTTDLEPDFAWSVWCSLSRESFVDASLRWESEERSGVSYFGWLFTDLPCYEKPTRNLKTNVVFQRVGTVMRVDMQECDHALWIEQTMGIDRKRVEAIAHQILHGR